MATDFPCFARIWVKDQHFFTKFVPFFSQFRPGSSFYDIMRPMKVAWVGVLSLGLMIQMAVASDQESTLFFKDTKVYTEFVDKARQAKLADQVEIWRNFLEQYPNSYFRSEVEYNLDQLEGILGLKHQGSTEVVDTKIFFKAKTYIEKNKLEPNDQILLWQQFLSDNPINIHNDEVRGEINRLRFSKKKDAQP